MSYNLEGSHMYIKKPVLFGIIIFFLALFVIGEYFYLEKKFSPTDAIVSNNKNEILVNEEKNIIVKFELTPTPIIADIKGVSIEATATSIPIPTITPSLTIQQVQNYLDNLYLVKTSWNNVKDSISSEDFNFLMDSFDRQISFCQTIVEHLISNPNPSEADLKLWDGIQKMWGETGKLTIELNKKLSQ